MRKLNSTSKRKWILSGALAFGAVALLTTGFATWIVGVNRTNQDGDVNVEVDTVTNSSIVLTFELGTDKQIVLAEADNKEGGLIESKGDKVAANPLRVDLQTLKVEYGNNSNFDTTYDTLHFDFVDPAKATDLTTQPLDSYKIKVTDSKLTGKGARSGAEWTYIECPNDIALSTFNKQEATGSITTITAKETTLDFKWGSFFEGKSPRDFYNSKYNKGTDDLAILTKASEEIEAELKAMEAHFKDQQGTGFKPIKIRASLIKASKQ